MPNDSAHRHRRNRVWRPRIRCPPAVGTGHAARTTRKGVPYAKRSW